MDDNNENFQEDDDEYINFIARDDERQERMLQQWMNGKIEEPCPAVGVGDLGVPLKATSPPSKIYYEAA